MAIQVGESIGHYQVVEELGMGGNGRVLKVQHLITRRREAMKILSNGRPTTQEYAHRVLREIRLQASLDHPNIAAVLNAFWLEDDLVMIMELIEGVALSKILEHRRLPLEQGLGIVRQVLQALDHAHQHGVIHRDVSTGNIIVSENGRVKLTDFGLAKGLSDRNATFNSTESGGMMGSPYYISPEQVRSAAAADQRSDIYSTGIVLYELLTGTRPFEADSTFLLMQAHVQMRPQAPIERNAAIPQYINDIILRAIAKKPADRFQTAAEFLAALDGLPAPEPQVQAVVASAPTIAPAVEHSHSNAVPNRPVFEDPPPAPRPKVAPALWRSALRNPAVGATLGIGLVLAAVAPVLLYDFAADRPRFEPALAPLPKIEIPAPQSPPPAALQPGPKELPVMPEGDAGLRSTRRSVAAPTRPKTAPTPPPVVIWGEVQTPKAVLPVPAPPAAKPAPATPVVKMEEPPALTPSEAQPVLTPSLPETGDTIRRKGLFRRLASGVKAINPLRKEKAPVTTVAPQQD